MELHDDDIMGLEGKNLEVRTWNWRRHVSRASGKEMLSCTYYGHLWDKPITEYLAVLHDGYAGDKAMRQLMSMAGSSGAQLSEVSHLEDSAGLDYVAVQMSNSKPPSTIEYKMDGQFHRVVKRSWA